jgi:hypothetical protein
MAKKSIKDIIEEKHPTFANMIKDVKSKEELDKNFIIYLRQKEDLIIQKARDEELVKLKAKKAELSKPYNQTISALKKMTNCIYKFGHKFEAEMREQFEKDLIEYAKQLSYIKMKKEEDRELQLVSEAITDINGDYDPTIKLLELKCEYISLFGKERFGLDEPKKIEI